MDSTANREEILLNAQAIMNVCDQCLVPFWSERKLIDHLRSTGHKSKCPGCTAEMDHKSISTHRRCCENKVRCYTCGEKYNATEILRHLSSHNLSINCPLGCGEVFFSNRLYRSRVIFVVLDSLLLTTLKQIRSDFESVHIKRYAA